MEELTNFLTQTNEVWTPRKSTPCSEFSVSELWHRSDDVEGILSHYIVRQSEWERWLKEGIVANTPSGRKICTLRFVWIEHNQSEQANDVSTEALDWILDAFKLKSVLAFSRTSFAGAAAFPINSATNTQQFVFCIHPKLILLWSHDFSRSTTQAICFANQTHIERLKEILNSKWSFAKEPLFPAFACALLLGGEIDRDQNEIKHEIREVEVRTGFHRWSGRTERPATGDLSILSAKMSGCATKMASIARKTKVIQELYSLILDNLCSPEADQSTREGQEVRTALDLKSATDLLRSRARMQTVDTDFIQHRISIQLTALFHLITQNDMLISHSVAQDSRVLAIASRRDSSSMKTLAVVTMFFLPGTFVASLFATPYFALDSDRGAVILHRNFGIYWAVTVPLTVVTLMAWTAWTMWREWRNRNESNEESAKLEKALNPPVSLRTESVGRRSLALDIEGGTSEIGSLVRRRTALERQKTG